MTWAQVAIIALMVCGLAAGWYRYSRETVPVRRLGELYLWLGPALPFLPFAVLEAMRGRIGVAVVVPVAAVHLVLLAAAYHALRTPNGAAATDARVAGGLLIFGSIIVWFGATTWPGMQLEKVAAHRAEHLFTTGAFLIGALLTLGGFTVLRTVLRESGDRFLSQLGLVSFLFGTVSWAMHLAFRATVMVSLAQETPASAAAPAWYGPLRLWSGAMYAIYMPLAYLAIAAFGAAMLKTGLAGKGWGRTFVVFGLGPQ